MRFTRRTPSLPPAKLDRFSLRLHAHALTQVISAPISQYDVENGRSACTCICLEAAMQILRGYADGVWAGTSESVTVSHSEYRVHTAQRNPRALRGVNSISSHPMCCCSCAAVSASTSACPNYVHTPYSYFVVASSGLRHRWGEQLRSSGSRWNALGGAHFCR